MSKTLEAIPQRTLEQEVLTRLREAILDGAFEPGAQLNQVHVAQQLGTSRGTIRAALAKLEEEGLIRSVPYRGTFVTQLDPRTLRDLYGLRSVLEAYGIRLSVPRVTDNDLAHLESIVDEMRGYAAGGEVQAMVAAELSFHRYLIELSGNQLLLQIWDSIRLHVRRSLAYRHQTAENLREVADSHLPLLAALRARDSASAEVTIVGHIDEAITNLMAHWPEDHP
jgi:DNA-binding GntR family transcriptional regulator